MRSQPVVNRRPRLTELRALFARNKSRRGATKAVLAVAASMLAATNFMLRGGVESEDLGSSHFDQLHRTKTIHRLVRRLRHLRCDVELTPQGASAM